MTAVRRVFNNLSLTRSSINTAAICFWGTLKPHWGELTHSRSGQSGAGHTGSQRFKQAETTITFTQHAAVMKGPRLIMMRYYLRLLHVTDMEAVVILKHWKTNVLSSESENVAWAGSWRAELYFEGSEGSFGDSVTCLLMLSLFKPAGPSGSDYFQPSYNNFNRTAPPHQTLWGRDSVGESAAEKHNLYLWSSSLSFCDKLWGSHEIRPSVASWLKHLAAWALCVEPDSSV